MAKSRSLLASWNPLIWDINLPYNVQKTQVEFGMVCINF